MNKNVASFYEPSFKLRLLLVLCALSVVAQLYIPLPILPQLAESFHVSQSTAAVVISAFGFAYAVGFLIFGPLSDQLGRQVVMINGLFALAVISAIIGWTDNALLLIIGRIGQGLAAAAFPPVVIAYLTERGSASQRRWGVAWLSTAFLCAGLLGQIYGMLVAARWGLAMAMLPLVFIYGCTGVALLMTPRDKRQIAIQSVKFSQYSSIIGLLIDEQLRRAYFAAVLLLLSFVTFYLTLDTHAGAILQANGINQFMVRLVALPAFFAPLLVSVVIARLGAYKMLIIGLSMANIGLLLCALADSDHLYVLLTASVLFVAGIGISVPSLITRVAELAPANLRGMAVALYTFLLFVGASLGPWFAGQLSDWSMANIFLLLATINGLAILYVSSKAVPAKL